MKNLISFLALLITTNHLIAQVNQVTKATDRASEASTLKLQMAGTTALFDFSSREGTNKLLEKLQIEGTPYSREESSAGLFYLNNQVIKTPTRLNHYLNGFEYVVDGKTYVTTSNTIDSVVLDSTTYVFRIFTLKGDKPPRVLKVIDRQGKNTIYVYRGVDFKPETKPGPMVDYKPAHFEWDDPIYIFEIGDKLVPLTNFKGLLAAYPGKENDIKKFIKANNISKDNPFALRLLMGYVCQL